MFDSETGTAAGNGEQPAAGEAGPEGTDDARGPTNQSGGAAGEGEAQAQEITEEERGWPGAFLSEASRLLADSLDYETTLRTVAGLAIPGLGAWCIVDIIEYEDHEPSMRRLAIVHPDPEKEQIARRLEKSWPPDIEDPIGAPVAMRTREPQLISDVTDDTLVRVARSEENLRDLRALGIGSFMVVPLIVREQVLGAITFVAPQESEPYTEHDVGLAEDLATRCAVAIDNARHYHEAVQARQEAERARKEAGRAVRARAETEYIAREDAALRKATQAVNATFTVEKILRQIAESAVDGTAAHGAFVERIDIERNEIEVVAEAGERTPGIGVRAPYQGSIAELVIERGKPELIYDLGSAEQPSIQELARTYGNGSAVVLPLMDAGNAIGALTLLRGPEGEPFCPDEIERAHTFANLAALAFRKVSLLDASEKKHEQLQRVMASRDRLIRGFSHDLKNPLGAAGGHAELLANGILGELSEKQRESVERIRVSIRSALALIDDLIDLARAEAGRLEIAREAVDVREVAREMAEEHRAEAEAKGLGMELRLPDELPVIESDSNRIHHIIGNLVSNAVKFTDEGGIEVRVALREGEEDPRPGRWILVDVSDSGPGISAGDRKRLFREFSRLDPGATEGAGLGLAISQRVARLLGGELTVESEVGKGSTFTLWLPLTVPAAEEETASSAG